MFRKAGKVSKSLPNNQAKYQAIKNKIYSKTPQSQSSLKMVDAQQSSKEIHIRSKFFCRLTNIPVISSAWEYASDIYGKAKNSGGLIGKSLCMTESVAKFAEGWAAPIVNRVSPIAAIPLEKVDSIANFGLEKLQQTVPLIQKRPQEFKEMITSRVNRGRTFAVNTLTSVGNLLLNNKPVKVVFDVYEYGINVMNAVVDKALPPTDKADSNGYLPGIDDEKSPDNQSERAWFLFKKTIRVCSKVAYRIFGIASYRVNSAQDAISSKIGQTRTKVKNAGKKLN